MANVTSGLATGLFIVPVAMAYAQLANVNPVYGLYSGIIATIVAALTTGTVLMISTLTSAIALATGSVLVVAGIESSQMPQALFTITFLAGLIMFALGILRLGNIVNFVSNSVMTGFVAGTALLIILGQEQHLTGYAPVGADQIQKSIDWLSNISQWDMVTLAVSIGVVVMLLLFKRVHALEKFAAIIVLLAATIIVDLFQIPTPLVSSIATIPNSLPGLMLPDFSLVPQLLLGSIAVAIVALAQGAAVSAAEPNPDGSKSSQSRDFVGQSLGNLVGCFFQSMVTGGALSQTGVSVGAGASNRWGGVFTGLWLALIVLLFGSYAEKVPLSVIGGVLVVIGFEILLARAPSARLVVRGGNVGEIAAMALTFFSALFIPLQYTIFLGAGLSLLLYVIASAHKLRVQEAVRLADGGWEMRDAPKELKVNEATFLVIQGLDFYAEVPGLSDQVPPARGVNNAVVVLILREMQTTSSTAVNWLTWYAQELQTSGSILMLADVNPAVLQTMTKDGALDVIGSENIFPATARILATENRAWEAAQDWLARHRDQMGDYQASP